MIIVAGTFRVPPGAMAALRPHAERTIAATRREAGCIVYSYALDLEDPDLVRVYEEWESREHLRTHFEAGHMAAWRAALAEIGAFGRSLKVHDADAGEPV